MVGAHKEKEQIVEGNNGRDLTFHAVVAEFNNRVDSERTTVPIDKVSATLTYTFFDKRTPIEINRGIWLSHGSRVDFGVNDPHRLMIATLEGDSEERYVYALNGSYSSTEPKRLRLSLRTGESLEMRLDYEERRLVMHALESCNGHKVHAANTLGISRQGLYTRLKKFGLKD
jgi:hypothetical protein